ncbi:MAG: hypothetical protein KDA45_14115, partial [Planctomycetales bacterium]|nr:hypothetical protein [Planctomycetales bacterium]
PLNFRLGQIPRVLGIDIPAEESERILRSLGCTVQPAANAATLSVTPPSWRGDLTREVDLIEEVARIHGYEKIPENVPVPLNVAAVRPKDIALPRIRHTLSAYGLDEAMTASVVPAAFEQGGSPWTKCPALETETPLLVGARQLRRSLLPSLLAARHANQTQSIRNAELYEIANLYFPSAEGSTLPREMCGLAMVTRGDLQRVKGVVEELLVQLTAKSCRPTWEPSEHPMFRKGSLQKISLGETLLGFVGLISQQTQDAMSLDAPVAAAELDVDALTTLLEEVRRAAAVSTFPSVMRDLNFVLDEKTTWSELQASCQRAAGELLQEVRYQETYRDTKKDGPGRKRVLLSVVFQSFERTLTNEEVDIQVEQIIAACHQALGAQLLA